MPEEAVPSYQIVLDGLQAAPIKMVFVAHFILTTWGIQGYWSPDSYLFYNVFFFLCLLWALHNKDAEDPILLAFVINILAVVFDVIVLCAYFPRLNYGSSERFSVGMAILNLVGRPASCLVLHKVWKDRQSLGSVGSMPAGRHQGSRSYQDMESPNQSFPGSESRPPAYH